MTEAEKMALPDKACELGFRYERDYAGCFQCVFAALQDTLDLRSDVTDGIFKSATALARKLHERFVERYGTVTCHSMRPAPM